MSRRVCARVFVLVSRLQSHKERRSNRKTTSKKTTHLLEDTLILVLQLFRVLEHFFRCVDGLSAAKNVLLTLPRLRVRRAWRRFVHRGCRSRRVLRHERRHWRRPILSSTTAAANAATAAAASTAAAVVRAEIVACLWLIGCEICVVRSPRSATAAHADAAAAAAATAAAAAAESLVCVWTSATATAVAIVELLIAAAAATAVAAAAGVAGGRVLDERLDRRFRRLMVFGRRNRVGDLLLRVEILNFERLFVDVLFGEFERVNERFAMFKLKAESSLALCPHTDSIERARIICKLSDRFILLGYQIGKEIKRREIANKVGSELLLSSVHALYAIIGQLYEHLQLIAFKATINSIESYS